MYGADIPLPLVKGGPRIDRKMVGILLIQENLMFDSFCI